MRAPPDREGLGFAAAMALAPALLVGGLVLALTAGQQSAVATPAGSPRLSSHVQRLADASLADAGGGRAARPVRIEVPSVGIDAAIAPTGADASQIVVPPVHRVGWFRGGPRPGEPGRTILIAHIDSLDGPAAFTGLPTVASGARVTVVGSDGTPHRYRISRTVEIPKPQFPADLVYDPTSRSTLVLITCTGAFHPDTGYEDNFIAFAGPVSR